MPLGITDDLIWRAAYCRGGYPGGKGLPILEIQCSESEVPIRVVEAIQACAEGARVRVSITAGGEDAVRKPAEQKLFDRYSGDCGLCGPGDFP